MPAIPSLAGPTFALLLGVIAPPPPPPPPVPWEHFDDVVERVKARRKALGERYAAAHRRGERAAILDEARAFIVKTLVVDVFPAWMGTPSAGGVLGTASMPHQPGMYVSCSYFVTAALQNAGLVLQSRTRFAQAPALWIQRALLPEGAPVRRYGDLAPADLERRLAADLRDGIYIVGLDIHVGFLVVRDKHVSIVHSSYTEPSGVVDERVSASEAIALSRRRGYWVSPLFQDDRLVEHWLRARPVPAPPAWNGHWTAAPLVNGTFPTR